MRVRALVLAAGFGARLAPLTDQVPKPLTPVRGLTPLELTLRRLAEAGCEAVAINLHHRGGAIRRAIGHGGDARWPEMEIVYSEEPEILGTFGALRPLSRFFAPADAALVINGDTLCRWPIKRLLRRHRRRGTVATLFFVRSADPADFGGGVTVAAGGRVRSFAVPEEGPSGTRGRRLVFGGAQVLSPDLISRVPRGFSETVPTLYQPLLEQGAHLGAVSSRRAWHDLGTPRRLRNAALAGGVRSRWLPWSAGSWSAPDADVDPEARLTRSVLESGATVEAGARVQRCVLLPGARICAGARLEGCVIGYHATVPGSARIRARLVCNRTADASLPRGASVVESLIYAPLDPVPR